VPKHRTAVLLAIHRGSHDTRSNLAQFLGEQIRPLGSFSKPLQAGHCRFTEVHEQRADLARLVGRGRLDEREVDLAAGGLVIVKRHLRGAAQETVLAIRPGQPRYRPVFSGRADLGNRGQRRHDTGTASLIATPQRHCAQ
jgi:hypothetical protein